MTNAYRQLHPDDTVRAATVGIGAIRRSLIRLLARFDEHVAATRDDELRAIAVQLGAVIDRIDGWLATTGRKVG
jgi:hypothetical protein